MMFYCGEGGFIMRLEGKVAVVTGAGGGIGSAISRLFVEEGAKVVGVDLRKTDMDALAKELGHNFIALAGDITMEETNEVMIDEAIREFGQVDILVLNAAVIDDAKTVEHMTDDVWNNTFAVNVNGPMYAMRYFIHKKLEAGEKGRIIGVTSIAGMAHPTACGAAFAASEAALSQLIKHAAYEYGYRGIKCNAIATGNCVESGLSLSFKDPDPEGLEFSMKVSDLSRHDSKPKELANAILFLASDEASHVNGAILNVDGGWSCC